MPLQSVILLLILLRPGHSRRAQASYLHYVSPLMFASVLPDDLIRVMQESLESDAESSWVHPVQRRTSALCTVVRDVTFYCHLSSYSDVYLTNMCDGLLIRK